MRLPRLPARYSGPGYKLIHADAVRTLNRLPDQSVDMIFADPPYRLSNGGTTVASGQRVAVDKGAWDESAGLEADHAYNHEWLRAARRVLKPSGTLWVSGTQHVIFSIGFAMQEIGYSLLNTITWFKPNASPNLGCRTFTHSTEILIWAAPAELAPLRHVYNDHDMRAIAGGVQMRDLWALPPPGPEEKTHGRHPTQKPLALLERVVMASTEPGQLVVDPFNGSGTTGVVAVRARRRYVGIDLDASYLDLTARRLGHPDAPRAPRQPKEDDTP